VTIAPHATSIAQIQRTRFSDTHTQRAVQSAPSGAAAATRRQSQAHIHKDCSVANCTD
jgi:hypothetical protein